MGLAASQARFLGITLRKANCEFQSTKLAEDRLRISNQLSDISQEYSNAMNATKLMWCSDIANDDYAINYNLLMLPSALNDYNPYFVSTKSGALLLNDKYAAAAKAAGIGMSGNIPSATQRNAFIEALGGSKGGQNSITGVIYDTDINLTTQETVDRILNGIGTSGDIEEPLNWNRTAGMGATPENKNVLDELLLSDLIEDANIGGAKLDWLQMYTKDGVYTENEVEILEKKYKVAISDAKNKYLADVTHSTSDLETLTTELESAPFVNEITTELTAATIPNYNTTFDESAGALNSNLSIVMQFKKLEYLIANAENATAREKYSNELANLKSGKNPEGNSYSEPTVYNVCWAYYDYIKNKPNGAIIDWTSKDSEDTDSAITPEYINRNSTTVTTLPAKTDQNGNIIPYEINMKDLFQTDERRIEEKNHDSDLGFQMTVAVNGVIDYNYRSLQNMTIADLLTNDIVIMNWEDSGTAGEAISEMSYRITKLMEYIAKIFGEGHIGTGLNIDDTSDQALTKALNMVKKKYLKPGNAVTAGDEWSETNITSNTIFKNANDYNRIGSNSNKDTSAVNLSNMVSAFLTYYHNYLTNSTIDYYVGKANDDTNGSKTYFVTDDVNYTYYTVDPEQMSNDEKIASFYDELYNNLCARGWRVDGQLDQPDYLEHMIKDGRYQLMSLNNDGYYYQTRYSQTGYLKEVTDEEAITRAETEYTRKKAELTYKEDLIDMKSKNLDAEIAELNTEMNSVQNMISKSIEKTFNMFQS